MLRSLEREAQERAFAAYWEEAPGDGGMSPGQRQFHEDKSNQRFLRAANKVGKTYAISAEVWGYLLGSHPLRHSVPPVTVLYVVADLESAYADDVCHALRELEPPGALHKDCKYDAVKGYIARGKRGLLCANGSRVIFRSGWQDGGALTGISAHVVVINEPPKEDRFGEIMRAASLYQSDCLMAFTPVDNHGTRDLRWLREIIEGEGSQWSQTVISLTPENAPHRTPEGIEIQIANCPESERPQRIHGDWDPAVQSRIFDGFDSACITGPPDVDLEIGLCMDHGEAPGNQSALVYGYWKDEDGFYHAHVIDEYCSEGRTTVDLDAGRITDKLIRHDLSLYDISRAHGDVNSAGKSALISVNQAFENAFAALCGMQWSEPPFRIDKPRKGPGSIMLGARVLNAAFIAGRLTISEDCKELARCLRQWKGTKTGADGDFTHLIDALRYGLTELLDPTRHHSQNIRVI